MVGGCVNYLGGVVSGIIWDGLYIDVSVMDWMHWCFMGGAAFWR